MPNATPTSTDIVKVLQGDAVMAITDPDEAARAIVTRILSAQTADDVLRVAGTLGADDVLGQPMVVHDVRWMKSAFDEGAGAFGVITITRGDDGQAETLTCGSRNVMAQIARLAQLKALPKECKLVRSEKPTSAGFYPLWLTTV
jgi:hypothetical protein